VRVDARCVEVNGSVLHHQISRLRPSTRLIYGFTLAACMERLNAAYFEDDFPSRRSGVGDCFLGERSSENP
jgi:hypothetical protein